jgi:mannose-6-phosphate isomerase-like protein (cupin superfamily)
VGVPEAELRSTKCGLVYDTDGWFVLNARESRWRDYGPLGAACDFEGKRPFRRLGINLNILHPGEPMAVYHREDHQEGFLVLAGECLLLVEGQERPLRQWDFFHCPSGTAHVILGAGDGPSVVLAFGACGGRKGVVYLVERAALTHGAGVTEQTTRSAEAYASFPPSRRARYREGWLPSAV